MTNNCPLYLSFCYIRVLLTVVENYEGNDLLQFQEELFTSFVGHVVLDSTLFFFRYCIIFYYQF